MVDSVENLPLTSPENLPLSELENQLANLTPEERQIIERTHGNLSSNRLFMDAVVRAINEGRLYLDSQSRRIAHECINAFAYENFQLIWNSLKGDPIAKSKVGYKMNNSSALALVVPILLIVIAIVCSRVTVDFVNASVSTIPQTNLDDVWSPYIIIKNPDGTYSLVENTDQNQQWEAAYIDGLEAKFLKQDKYMDNVKVDLIKEVDPVTTNEILKYKITFEIWEKPVEVIFDNQVGNVSYMIMELNKSLQSSGLNLVSYIVRRNATDECYAEEILFLIVQEGSYHPVSVVFSLYKELDYGDELDEIDNINYPRPKPYYIVPFANKSGTRNIQNSFAIGIKLP